MNIYGVYETHPHAGRKRIMADLEFASVEAGLAHFRAQGAYAEKDAAWDAGDVFTAGGMVLAIEPVIP